MKRSAYSTPRSLTARRRPTAERRRIDERKRPEHMIGDTRAPLPLAAQSPPLLPRSATPLTHAPAGTAAELQIKVCDLEQIAKTNAIMRDNLTTRLEVCNTKMLQQDARLQVLAETMQNWPRLVERAGELELSARRLADTLDEVQAGTWVDATLVKENAGAGVHVWAANRGSLE